MNEERSEKDCLFYVRQYRVYVPKQFKTTYKGENAHGENFTKWISLRASVLKSPQPWYCCAITKTLDMWSSSFGLDIGSFTWRYNSLTVIRRYLLGSDRGSWLVRGSSKFVCGKSIVSSVCVSLPQKIQLYTDRRYT